MFRTNQRPEQVDKDEKGNNADEYVLHDVHTFSKKAV